MTTLAKRQFAGIDRFRLIAAVLVVTVHTWPLADISAAGDFILTRILARTAVPFFFMASGFFLFPETGGRGKPASFIKKAALLYAVAILVYLPVNVYAGTLADWRYLPNLLSDIVFNGTFYHLWYLPAAITGAAVVWLLLKKLKPSRALAVCLVLYAIGLLGDSYYGITERVPALSAAYGALFSVFDYTRNGLFFAPVFFMLGALISRREKLLPLKTSLIGLGASLAVMLAEGLLLRRFGFMRHDSMYVLLPVCMYFLFASLLHREGKSKKSLRDVSMLVYLLHPAAIVAVRGFAGAFGLEGLLVVNNAVHFLTVLACAFAAALVVTALLGRIRKTGRGPTRTGRAWCEISAANIRHNVETLRSILPENCAVMAVVKAEAYGHGAAAVARNLNSLGVRNFAVAALDEGIRLRKSGVAGDILVLGYTDPARARDLHRYRLTQTVLDASYAEALDGFGRPLSVHIKINTGMNRLGEASSNVTGTAAVFHMKNLRVDGIYTHLSVSDSREDGDAAFTKLQIERFYSLLEALEAEGVGIPKLHIQSTYGVLNYPALKCDYARVGLGIYGVLSRLGDETVISPDFKPVLSLKARVALVRTVEKGEDVSYGREFTASKTSKIAVAAIGFADGVPRSLSSGKGSVLIKGRRAPIAGRVCMDQLMVDVTDIPDVKRGDVVTLIGTDGGETRRAEDVAEEAGTITNELLSRLGARLERIFIQEG